MYFGSNDNTCAKTWADYPTASAAAADGALAVRQKLSLLPHLVRVSESTSTNAYSPQANSTPRR